MERRLYFLPLGVQFVLAGSAGFEEGELLLAEFNDVFQAGQFRVFFTSASGTASSITRIGFPLPQRGDIAVPLRFLLLQLREPGLGNVVMSLRRAASGKCQHTGHLSRRFLICHRRYRSARDIPVGRGYLLQLADGAGELQLFLRVDEVQQVALAFNQAGVDLPRRRAEVVELVRTAGDLRLQIDHGVVDLDAPRAEIRHGGDDVSDGGVVLRRGFAGIRHSFRQGLDFWRSVVLLVVQVFRARRCSASAFFNLLISSVQNGKRSLIGVYGGCRFFVFFFQPFVFIRQNAESTSLRGGHALRFHSVVDGLFVECYGFFIGKLLVDTAVVHIYFPVSGQDVLGHAVSSLIVNRVLPGFCPGFFVDKTDCDFPEFVYVVDTLPFFVVFFCRLFQESNQFVTAQVFVPQLFSEVIVFIGQVLDACRFRGRFFKGLPPRLFYLTVNHDKGADGSNHKTDGGGRRRHVGSRTLQHISKVLEGITHVFECAYDLFALEDDKQTRCRCGGKTGVVRKVHDCRGKVQNTFDKVGVNSVGDKLRPGVLEDVGLGFPSVQHDADLLVGASGALRSLVQHLLHHVEVLDKSGQLVGAQLSTQAGKDFKEFSLIDETFLAGLGERGDGLHRVHDGPGCFRCRERVFCIYLKDTVQGLHGFLRDFDSVLILADGSEDVQYQCAEGGGSLGAGLLRYGSNSAEGGDGLLKGHSRLRRNAGYDGHTRRQLFDAGSVVVLDDVCGVQRLVQSGDVAVHFPRRVGSDQELVGDCRGNVTNELRLGGNLRKLFGLISETGLGEFRHAFQIVLRGNAVSGRHFVCGLRCFLHLLVGTVCDFLDIGKLRVHLFHGGQGLPQAADDLGDDVAADIPAGEFLDVHPEGFRHLVKLFRLFAGVRHVPLQSLIVPLKKLYLVGIVLRCLIQIPQLFPRFPRLGFDIVKCSLRVLRLQVLDLPDKVGILPFERRSRFDGFFSRGVRFLLRGVLFIELVKIGFPCSSALP